MKKIKIPTPKGKIAAVVHYPKIKTNKLAILCPGYLDSKDYDHLKTLAEDLANEGYTTVRFDPIGTWESDGDISDYTFSNYLENIKQVIDFMTKKQDFKYIMVGGHSRGGFASILYATKDSRVSLVLSIMAPSSLLKTVYREKIKLWKTEGFRTSFRDVPDKKERREFKVPFSNIEEVEGYDLLNEVDKIHVPIIFLAGELDSTVASSDVKEIFDNANEPKKFILIPGIGHDYRKNPSEIKLVNDEIIRALKTYEN